MTLTIKIDGMSCGHCSARVEKAINALGGHSAKVSLAEKTATVEGDKLDEQAIRTAITDAGYKALP